MSPFCRATDTPVSDFWWCLLWVSKPEWVLPYLSLAEAYVLHYTFPEIHLWCDTCRPLGSQHGSWAICSTYLGGIGWTRNQELSCRHSQCEIRQTLYRLSYPGSACKGIVYTQWLIQDFPEDGGTKAKRGQQSNNWETFCQNLHDNEIVGGMTFGCATSKSQYVDAVLLLYHETL